MTTHGGIEFQLNYDPSVGCRNKRDGIGVPALVCVSLLHHLMGDGVLLHGTGISYYSCL